MELIRDFQGNKYYWEYYVDDDTNANYLFAYQQNTGQQVKDERDGNAESMYRLLLEHEINKDEIDKLVTGKS
jgi:hypothetical protein